MTMRRILSLDPARWRLFYVAVLVAGCAWILLSRLAEGAVEGAGIPSPRAGFAAPDVSLGLLDGGAVRLSDLRGQALVLNVWASWCEPCRVEMPALEALNAAYADRGVVVLGVNSTIQDREQAARDFVSEFALTFPIALDPEGQATRAYQVRAWPSTFFIDRDGVIRRVVIGGP